MGTVNIKNEAEPSTPETGYSEIYVDPTSKKLSTKDDAGTVTDYNAASKLKSATTKIDIESSPAPTVGQVLKATSDSAATWQDEAGGASGGPQPISSTEPLASALAANEVEFYINEDANTINFKLKYADGTVKRAVLPLFASAAWGTLKQYTLDNVDDYFSSEVTGSELGISGSSAFTIALTLNFDMTATDQAYLFSLFSGTSTGKVELLWLNSVFRFNVGANYTQASPTRADKNYHIVLVYDGALSTDITRAKIYVDAVDETVSASGTIPSTMNTEIADSKPAIGQRYAPVASTYFNGSVREVSIYNKALSSSEVSTLYNSGAYSDPLAISGCVSSWWFGDNPTDNLVTVVDNVGANNLDGQSLDDGVITSV